jgi:hypothetical protein
MALNLATDCHATAQTALQGKDSRANILSLVADRLKNRPGMLT